MTGRPRAALIPPAAIAAGAALIWLAFGHGFANYDTFYALLWGNEIAGGQKPDYGAPIPPTPHPLATLAGVALAPLDDGAEMVAVAIGFISLAAIAYLVFRLGWRWFNPWVGVLAALIVVTREPILSNAARVYVDVPYIALVLAALLLEDRRPRAGWPVLALLALAGLLRPEAWLFAAAYLLYLAYTHPERPAGRLGPLALLAQPGRLLGPSVIAASAPLLWAAFDLWATGDPLHSLTGTRDTVATLERHTGLLDALRLGPRRLGEILHTPAMIAAAGGGLLSLFLIRRRVTLGAASGLLAAAAFLVLATAGLAVITRYLMLTATILAVFAAAGVLGWLSLPREHRWRRPWMAFGAVVGVPLVVLALPIGPSIQYDRLASLQDSIAAQERAGDELHDLVEEGAFEAGEAAPGCGAVSVPNTRAVPLLALWLDRRPSEIAAADVERSGRGYFLEPATEEVGEVFVLDPGDPGERTAAAPPGFRIVAANDSWRLYFRCPGLDQAAVEDAPGPD